jgi:hypothetical protein
MASTKRTARAETKQVARDQWARYFDGFTRRYLTSDEQAESATIEVVSPTLGDQFNVRAVRLIGIAYDHKDHVLELQLEDMEHLVFDPAEIWVIEGEDGFISTLEVLHADGGKEIVYLRKSGLPSSPYASPSAPL